MIFFSYFKLNTRIVAAGAILLSALCVAEAQASTAIRRLGGAVVSGTTGSPTATTARPSWAAEGLQHTRAPALGSGALQALQTQPLPQLRLEDAQRAIVDSTKKTYKDHPEMLRDCIPVLTSVAREGYAPAIVELLAIYRGDWLGRTDQASYDRLLKELCAMPGTIQYLGAYEVRHVINLARQRYPTLFPVGRISEDLARGAATFMERFLNAASEEGEFTEAITKVFTSPENYKVVRTYLEAAFGELQPPVSKESRKDR